MRLLRLDLNQMGSEEEVHNYLMEQLRFPEYYGKNLDALYDMLTSGLEENVCVELARCTDEASPIYGFSKKIEKVLVDAAESLDEREGKLYAVFADSESMEVPAFCD